MSTIAFARGVPSSDLIPHALLTEHLAQAVADAPTTIYSYGTGYGLPALTAELARRHGVDQDRIVATTGSLHGFALLIEVLAEQAHQEGRTLRVAVERPTYDRPLLVLQRMGVEVVQIPTDDDGLIVADLAREHERRSIDLVYVIPTFQNPSGVTMTEDRRIELQRLATEQDLPVLEDDPYGLLWFEAKPPASVWSRLPSDLGWFMGSFSKTLSPGLRVGYLILPKQHAARVATRANDTYISASFPAQATVASILQRDGLIEHTARTASAQLASRCQGMRSAIAELIPTAVMSTPGGGYFLWVEFGTPTNGESLARCTSQGVTYVPGVAFGGSATSARLAFSPCTEADIRTGIERLAAVLAPAPAGT